MGYATEQRQAFSDALLEVGPTAPTLCAGWNAHDLAAHCWVRERSIKAVAGLASKRLEHWTNAAMASAKEQMSFVELATRLRETPTTPLTVVPGADDLVNAVEYLVHTEDVRRANAAPLRAIDPAFEDLLWKRLRVMGRIFFAHASDGVVLERSDADGAAPLRVKAGASTVTVIGRPSELVLFGFGRQSAADVRLIGEDAAVLRLRNAKLGA